MSMKNHLITDYKTSEGTYRMNSEKTLDNRREQLSELSKKDNTKEAYLKDFDDMLKSGTDHKVRIAPQGDSYYRVGNIGGNYLSKEYPGKTPEQRRENMQLPPMNDGKKLSEVKLDKAQLVVDSKIAPQAEWAKTVGYKEKAGFEQTYLLEKRKSTENEDRYSKKED